MVDFNMPFMALVGMLVKVTLAYIPAAIVLGALALLVWFILGALGIGLRSLF